MDADVWGGWNQEEDKYPVLVISITGYIIIYVNCMIIWASHQQNINSTQDYGGIIHCSFANHEGYLTFGKSNEVNQVHNQYSRRHLGGAVQSVRRCIYS